MTGTESKLEELQDKIDNAVQAMSETSRSWEHRCHSIMVALGVDFGGPAPDIPEQDSWYARQLKLAQSEAFEWKRRAMDYERHLKELKKGHHELLEQTLEKL